MVVYMGVVQDVTEEHRADEQLREQLLFIQRIASRIPGFIYQYRLHSDGTTARVQYISDAVTQFLGVTPHEVAQDHGLLLKRVLPEDAPHLRRSAVVSARRMLPWRCEYRVVGPDGSVRWHDQRRAPQRAGRHRAVAWVHHGYHRPQAGRARDQAAGLYDALTGLPNRRLLLDRLQRAIVAGQRTKAQGALLFIDLDNFRT